MQIFTLLSIVFPILAGVIMLIWAPEKSRPRNAFVLTAVLLSSLFLLVSFLTTIFMGSGASAFTVFDFGNGLGLSFRLDRPAIFLTAVNIILWPLTAFYAFSFLKTQDHPIKALSFFLILFGLTSGMSFARNFITLYFFYEWIQFLPLPLIILTAGEESKKAGKAYLIQTVTSAVLLLFMILVLYTGGSTLEFTWGGLLDSAKTAGNETLLQFAFLIGMIAYGVKSVAFPIHGWLPLKTDAPIPDTVLLYEIPIVNMLVFSMMRMIYFGFGTEFLYGTAVQNLLLVVTAGLILYGSARALRTQFLKQRLGCSTTSNLSYIILSFLSMTPAGLSAGLLYIIVHSLIKLTLFFCGGAILHNTGRKKISELERLHVKMPFTCLIFSFASMAIMGIPPLCGFIGKFAIGCAVADLKTPAAIIGTGAFILSAAMTVIYMIDIIIRFYFSRNDVPFVLPPDVQKADGYMRLPLILLSALIIALSFLSAPLLSVLNNIGTIL